jgi:hypothetical protein
MSKTKKMRRVAHLLIDSPVEAQVMLKHGSVG